MYGMLFSIKAFVNRISPTPPKDGFYYYKTDTYKLNYYETATGLKFVLNTDPKVGDMRELLFQIYSEFLANVLVGSGRRIVRSQGNTRARVCSARLSRFTGVCACVNVVHSLSLFSSGDIYVEHVVKNPLCKLDEPITSELFISKLDAFVRTFKEF